MNKLPPLLLGVAVLKREIAEGETTLAQTIAENASEDLILEIREGIEWYRLQLANEEFIAAHNPVDVAALKDWRARMAWFLHEGELDKERAPRVYAWEDANIHPHATLLRDAAAEVDMVQWVINRIWANEGLLNPPALKVVTAYDRPDCSGWANRSTITIRSDPCLDTVLFHELAHSMARARLVDDNHGPFWLGIYMRLLSRVLWRKFKMKDLRTSATAAGLKFKTRLPKKPW